MSHQPKGASQERFENNFQKKVGKNAAGGNQRSGYSGSEKSNLSGGGNRGQQNAPRTGKKPNSSYNRSDSLKHGNPPYSQSQSRANDAQDSKNPQASNVNGNSSWTSNKPQSIDHEQANRPATEAKNPPVVPSADSFGPPLTSSLSQANNSALQPTGAGKLSFAAAAASALKSTPQTTPQTTPQITPQTKDVPEQQEPNPINPPNLQFGSFGPNFNGLQIPPRTASAPPNLDEQRRTQAKFEASKLSDSSPKPQAQPSTHQSQPQQQRPPDYHHPKQHEQPPQKISNQQPSPRTQQLPQQTQFQPVQQNQPQSQRQQNQNQRTRGQAPQKQNVESKSYPSQHPSSATPQPLSQPTSTNIKQIPPQQVRDSTEKNQHQSDVTSTQHFPQQIQSTQTPNDVPQARKTETVNPVPHAEQKISNQIQPTHSNLIKEKNEKGQLSDAQNVSSKPVEIVKLSNQQPQPLVQQPQVTNQPEADGIRHTTSNKDQQFEHRDPNPKRQNPIHAQPKSPEIKPQSRQEIIPPHSNDNRHHEIHSPYHHGMPHQTNIQKNGQFVHDEATALPRNLQPIQFGAQMHHGVSNNGPLYSKGMHSPTMNQIRMPFHPPSNHHANAFPSPNHPFPDRTHPFPQPQHQSTPLEHSHHFNSDIQSHMGFSMPPDLHGLAHGQLDESQFNRQSGLIKQPIPGHMRQTVNHGPSVLPQQIPMHQQPLALNPTLAGNQQGGLALPNLHSMPQNPLNYNQPPYIPSVSHNPPLMQQSISGTVPNTQVPIVQNLGGSGILTQFIPTPLLPSKQSKAIKIMDPKTHQEIKFDKPKPETVPSPPVSDNLSVSPINSQGVSVRPSVPTSPLQRPSIGYTPTVNTIQPMYNSNFPINPNFGSHGRGSKPIISSFGPNQTVPNNYSSQVPLSTTQSRDTSVPNPVVGKPGPNAIPIMMPPSNSSAVAHHISSSKSSTSHNQSAQKSNALQTQDSSIKRVESEVEPRTLSSLEGKSDEPSPVSSISASKANTSTVKSDSTVNSDLSAEVSDNSTPELPVSTLSKPEPVKSTPASQNSAALESEISSRVEPPSKKLVEVIEKVNETNSPSTESQVHANKSNDISLDKSKDSGNEEETEKRLDPKPELQASLGSKPNSNISSKETEEKEVPSSKAREFELGSTNLDKFPPLVHAPQNKVNGVAKVSDSIKTEEVVKTQVESKAQTSNALDPVSLKPTQSDTSVSNEVKENPSGKMVWGKWVPDVVHNQQKVEPGPQVQPSSKSESSSTATSSNSEEKSQIDNRVLDSSTPLSIGTVKIQSGVSELSTTEKKEGDKQKVEKDRSKSLSEEKTAVTARSDNPPRGKKDKKKGGKNNQRKTDSIASEVKNSNEPKPANVSPPSVSILSAESSLPNDTSPLQPAKDLSVESIKPSQELPADTNRNSDESVASLNHTEEQTPKSVIGESDISSAVLDKKSVPVPEEKTIERERAALPEERKIQTQTSRIHEPSIPVVDVSSDADPEGAEEINNIEKNDLGEKVAVEKSDEANDQPTSESLVESSAETIIQTESEPQTQNTTDAVVDSEAERPVKVEEDVRILEERDIDTQESAESEAETIPKLETKVGATSEPIHAAATSIPTKGGRKKMKDAIAKKNASEDSSDLLDAFKIPDKVKPAENLQVSPEPNASGTESQRQNVSETQPNDPDDWEDVDDDRLIKPKSKLITSNLDTPSNRQYSRDFLLFHKSGNTEVSENVRQNLIKFPELFNRQQELGHGGQMAHGDRRGNFHRDQPGDVRWARDNVPAPAGRAMGLIRPDGFGGFRPGGGPILRPALLQPFPVPPQMPGGIQRAQSDRWEKNPQFLRNQPPPRAPFPPIHKSENRYEIGKVSDEEQKKQRTIKSILNKLTPQNFEKLFEQVKEANIDSAATLTAVISQIFDKALLEPTFCELYAEFCLALSNHLPQFTADDEKITFKRVLLNKCQEEFERNDKEEREADAEEGQDGEKVSDEVRAEKKVKARRRMLGNIRFIGELFKKKMLSEKIMHSCIQKLLGISGVPDEENVEALCKLMTTIGSIIDHAKAKDHVDAYMNRIESLSQDENLPVRHRFMLKDLIDLRKHRWQARRKVEGPKKIEDVHRDAVRERQDAVVSADRQLERSGTGSRSGRRDFGSDLPRSGSRSSLNMGGSGERSGPRFGGDRPGYSSPMEQSRPMSMPQRSTDMPMRFGPQGSLGRSSQYRGLQGDAEMSSRATPVPISRTGELSLRPSNPQGGFDQSSGSARLSRASSSSSLAGEERGGEKRDGRLNPARSQTSAGRPTTPPVSVDDSTPKTLSEADLERKCLSILKEFFSINQEKEVKDCLLQEIPPSQYEQVMYIWIKHVLETVEAKRKTFVPLIRYLCSDSPVFSADHLSTGFCKILKEIEDFVMDVPKSPNLIGDMIGSLIAFGILEWSSLTKILDELKPDLKEELITSESVIRVLICVVSAMHNQKGEDWTLSLLNTSSSSGFKFSSYVTESDDVSKLLERNYPDCPSELRSFFGVS